MDSLKKNWPLLTASALALIGVAIFRAFSNWNNLNLTVKVSDLAGLLASLAFAATVIERAVEILVSPWRDEGASKLDKAVAAIKARPADPATDAANATALKAASDALDEYRGETQRYAFAVSLVLSITVSIAGVRTLGPFVDSATLKDSTVTADAQRLFFLAGGSPAVGTHTNEQAQSSLDEAIDHAEPTGNLKRADTGNVGYSGDRRKYSIEAELRETPPWIDYFSLRYSNARARTITIEAR